MSELVNSASYGRAAAPFTVDPNELILVWPERHAEMGPNDVTVVDQPQMAWALAEDIVKPIRDTDVESVLAKLPGEAGPCGLIQPLVVVLMERDLIGEWRICQSSKLRTDTRFVVVAGRTRTRWLREANRRIVAAGGDETAMIMARCERRFLTEVGCMVVRDVENRCRKPVSILDMAKMARYHIQQGTQRHVVLSALGCTSWQNVLNYASVLDLVPSIQQLVDDKSIPLQEALRIGRETAAKQEEIGRKLLNLLGDTLPKARRKLSARDVAKARGAGAPVAMSVPLVRAWFRRLEEAARTDASAVLVRAVLSTIIGEGDMSKFARFAPPPLKNARFARKKTKKTKPTQKDAST